MHGLLSQDLADNANVNVVSPEVTQFQAEWLDLTVTQERLVCGTTQEPYVRVHDLLVRTFKERLPHTPLAGFGLNRQAHCRVSDASTRKRLFERLAPIDPWSSCSTHFGLDDDRSGLQSIKMSQNGPGNRPHGDAINVTVEPSIRIADGAGVYVAVNDHYTLQPPDSPESCVQLIGLLEESFDTTLRAGEPVG